MRRRYLLYILGILLILSTACRNLERERERESEAQKPARAGDSTEIILDDKTVRLLGIETVTVERTTLPLVVRATGRIVPQVQRTREVRTLFAGRVESVTVEINEVVSTGQVLAMLASPALPALRADLAKAEATLATAQKTFDRQKRLTEIGAGSQRELQQAQLELDAARIERERSLLRIRESGLDPDKLLGTNPRLGVTAPQHGVVVERAISPGELVAADTLLFRIVNTDIVDALLDLYEMQLGRVRAGQQVEVRVPAYPNRVFRGRVTSVGAVLNPQSRTAQARVTLSNPQHLLKPEMLCEADVIAGEKANAVAIPESALVDDDGVPVVYVRTGQKYGRRPVQLGAKTLRVVEIVAGLNPGEVVVTQGGYQLRALGLKARPEAEHEN